jgi:hypothetical protein
VRTTASAGLALGLTAVAAAAGCALAVVTGALAVGVYWWVLLRRRSPGARSGRVQ